MLQRGWTHKSYYSTAVLNSFALQWCQQWNTIQAFSLRGGDLPACACVRVCVLGNGMQSAICSHKERICSPVLL